MLERLQERQRQGLLGDLDLHFARLMGRLDKEGSPELLLGAALASAWTASGHVCVDLRELAGRSVLDSPGPDSAQEALIAPSLDRWLAALRTSPVVGRPGDYRPLVLDKHGRLYLYRYWDYERQLATDLLARAGQPVAVDEARLAADLEALFPHRDDATDWQKLAAAAAALKGLCVISGGPGTGKTTTVIRILALLLGQSQSPTRIALAAPTGKAAGRMQEAIRKAKQTLNLPPDLAAAIPEQAATVHRLLGVKEDGVYFRHDRDNPLPVDLLVVDEASMVDLALLAKLLWALPPSARLLLLGDRDQLASVEAGAVLGDICGGGADFTEPFRERLARLTGETLDPGPAQASTLADCVVLLKRSYRFGADSGIGQLARAVNGGDAAAALELLKAGRHGDLAWRSPASPRELEDWLAEAAVTGFKPYLDQLRAGAEPRAVFAAFDRFRVLAALRRGPVGVMELNRAIEGALQGRRLINARTPWYRGRPVMITRNDYNLRLYNGDVGICLPDPQDPERLRVCFQAVDGEPRWFPPSRLPAHETVYAMTIHKSQGSEFERVLMVLPFEPSRILTRELVYTGLTRARAAVELWCPAGILKAAAGRRLHRASGLAERLWG